MLSLAICEKSVRNQLLGIMHRAINYFSEFYILPKCSPPLTIKYVLLEFIPSNLGIVFQMFCVSDVQSASVCSC